MLKKQEGRAQELPLRDGHERMRGLRDLEIVRRPVLHSDIFRGPARTSAHRQNEISKVCVVGGRVVVSLPHRYFARDFRISENQEVARYSPIHTS